MHTNLQRLMNQRPTARARLRGILGVHFNDLATSLFHFVAQQLLEQPKPCIVCGKGQVLVFRHELKGQLFKDNHAIAKGQQAFKPHISTYSRTFNRDGLGIRHFNRQANIPLAQLTLDHDVLDLGLFG